MASVKGRVWSRDELLHVLKLYCQTPFGRIHSRNPEIIAAAKILNRTPSSVALKMTNFASLDPTIEQKGMGNYSKLDKVVWDEFFSNMDSYLDEGDEASDNTGFSDVAQAEFLRDLPSGLDVIRAAKARTNQNFFRSMILASYESRCAITGIDAPNLLVASHIVPWSADASLRTNPRNGICLNALHDRAFDRGLITIADDLSVVFSTKLPSAARDALASFSEKKMRLPSRFVPDMDYLAYHRRAVFSP